MAVCLAVAVGAIAETELERAIQVHEEATDGYRIHKAVQIGAPLLGLIAAMLIEVPDPITGEVNSTQAVIGSAALLVGAAVGLLDWALTARQRGVVERLGNEVGFARSRQLQAERASDLERRFNEREQNAIQARIIFLGMSEAAMLESRGQPIGVNRTVTAAGEHKQYVYPGGVYIYTEDGVVTSWQD